MTSTGYGVYNSNGERGIECDLNTVNNLKISTCNADQAWDFEGSFPFFVHTSIY